jgi:hypothetical protein
MQRLFIVVVFLIGLTAAASAADISPGQVWKSSNSGSILKITSVDRRGNFQGTFTDNTAGTPCLGMPYPASGSSFGPMAKFTVNFVKCRATKSWQGNALYGAWVAPWVMQYIDPNGKPATSYGFDDFFIVGQRH